MRKILSKEEEAKRTRRNQFLIGGAMILIMVASTLGYAFSREQTTSSEKIIYNGLEFVKQSGFWTASKDSYQLFFKYTPKETEEISSKLNLLSSYSNKPLYIYSDSTEAAMEVYNNLFYQNRIVERVQDACIEGENCSENYPVKTCDNNFIIIRESETESIRQNKSCVFIEGNRENLTKLSDSFLFKITGITQ